MAEASDKLDGLEGTSPSPGGTLTGLPGRVTGALGLSFVQQIGRIVPGNVGLVVPTRLPDTADFGIVGIAALWIELSSKPRRGLFGPAVVASRGLKRESWTASPRRPFSWAAGAVHGQVRGAMRW